MYCLFTRFAIDAYKLTKNESDIRMILVIDGYNLLKHIDPDRFIDEHERLTFLHELARYARFKKHKVVVVFDGGPYQWPHKESVMDVKVIYSGVRETADTVIMHYLADHHAKDLLLVSSDHELNLFASKHDVVSIGSDDFYQLLRAGLKEAEGKAVEVPVRFDEDEQDVDTLMEQASAFVPRKEEDIMPRESRMPQGRRSKKDRLLLKKLKKL